ncbi:MAG: hypothetical protein PVG04_02115 [Anaerolineales bacterium]|jgi:hypothetical protein
MHKSGGWVLIRTVLIKTIILFVFLNLLFALVYPLDFLGSISAYNLIFPGRLRFPHSDVPERAFNITTSNLEAMFQSHEISREKDDEFRIAVIGDSSVWGFLLEPRETFTASLNKMELQTREGIDVRFYNLGYPTLSVTKDLLLLDRAMEQQPDMILWFVTLESLVEKTQLESPILQLNPAAVGTLFGMYGLSLQADHDEFETHSFFDMTIVGSRVELSELIRLQLYGFAWAATGVDHYIPESYNQRSEDLSAELEYKGFQPGELESGELYFEALNVGIDAAESLPVVLINEPIFVSSGKNSDIRYNFFYPRWAYDQYRSMISEQVSRNEWDYVDLWDLVPASEFTDSAIHYSVYGNKLVADRIADLLQTQFDFSTQAR